MVRRFDLEFVHEFVLGLAKPGARRPAMKTKTQITRIGADDRLRKSAQSAFRFRCSRVDAIIIEPPEKCALHERAAKGASAARRRASRVSSVLMYIMRSNVGKIGILLDGAAEIRLA
jgi:hypothetical protein